MKFLVNFGKEIKRQDIKPVQSKCPGSPTIENTRYDQGGNIVQMIRETVVVFVASLAIQIVDDSGAARNFMENFSIDLSNIRYNKDPFKRKTVILLENGKTLYKLDNVMFEPALAENCRIPPLFKTARPKIGSVGLGLKRTKSSL
uniref:Uncharacterized protein n=1 Tax=Romanomermis culicivorax TaxID=13658 RepID=A0A915IFG0_ROMCU